MLLLLYFVTLVHIGIRLFKKWTCDDEISANNICDKVGLMVGLGGGVEFLSLINVAYKSLNFYKIRLL